MKGTEIPAISKEGSKIGMGGCRPDLGMQALEAMSVLFSRRSWSQAHLPRCQLVSKPDARELSWMEGIPALGNSLKSALSKKYPGNSISSYKYLFLGTIWKGGGLNYFYLVGRHSLATSVAESWYIQHQRNEWFPFSENTKCWNPLAEDMLSIWTGRVLKKFRNPHVRRIVLNDGGGRFWP